MKFVVFSMHNEISVRWCLCMKSSSSAHRKPCSRRLHQHEFSLLNCLVAGTYHTYPGSSAQKHQGAFTLRQFLDANIPNKHIYLGGKLSYSDPQISTLYETVPEGMVSRFVALPANPVKPYTKLWSSAESTSSDKDTADRLYRDFSAANYVAITHASWGAVSAKLAVSNLPDLVQYPMETWEWTIGRDYKDRVTGTSSW